MKLSKFDIAARCLLWSLAFCFMIPCSFAYYEVDVEESSIDDNMIAIYGQACEKIRNNEPKSSARVRVTDKATFLGVSDISGLSEIKEKLSDHDFNVLVYNIVDNLVEDMAVRTLQQEDAANLCVEVTGFINRENIFKAAEDVLSAADDDEDYEVVVEKKEENKPTVQNVENVIPKPLVYVAPTEFYNDTKSSKHAEILKNMISSAPNFGITDDKVEAKYILSSKVLRAKVEPINSNTNRLQMVVAVELNSPVAKININEHQNKFVLFGENEDEQRVAADLMKKLLEKALIPIIDRMESIEAKNRNNGAFITPTSGIVIREED